MKRITTIFILAIMLAVGCTKDIEALDIEMVSSLNFSAEKFALTRVETTYESSIWEADDAIGITCSNGDGNIEHKATIDGDYVNFNVASGNNEFEYVDDETTYSAYYPYQSGDGTTYLSDISGQDGQDVSLDPFDIGSIDFLTAKDTAPTGSQSKVNFDFHHGLALLYFNIEVGDSEVEKVDATDLFLQLTDVPTKATYNFSSESWSVEDEDYGDIICNKLSKSYNESEDRHYFSVSLIVNPCALTKSAKLNIYDDESEIDDGSDDHIGAPLPPPITFELPSYKFEADKKYTFNLRYGENEPVFTTPITITDWSDDGDATTLDALDEVDIYFDGEVYNIFTADGLFAFADLVNGSENSTDAITMGDDFASFGTVNNDIKGKLADDIDLENRAWNPIGISDKDGDPTFNGGSFDGDGHTITNLSVNCGYAGAGLFGYIYDTTISNIIVGGHSSGSAGHVGLIAGKAYYTTFENCETLAGSTVELTTSSDSAAGISGYVKECDFISCINRAKITNYYNNTGGITGYANPYSITTFTDCKNFGDISSAGCAGGIMGFTTDGDGDAKIFNNCYNAGNITTSSSNFAGGIAGKIYGDDNDGCALVINCVNVGNVTAQGNHVGGIVGACASGQVYNCYNWGDIKGVDNVGGLVGILEQKDGNGVDAILINGYSCGTVSGTSKIGGVIGAFDSSTINSCYYDSEICTLSNDYGTGMATAHMKSLNLSKFLSYNAASITVSHISAFGWVYDGDYPTLDGAPDVVDVDIYYDGDIYYIYTAKGMKAFADLVNGNKNTTNAITDSADGATFASFEVKQLYIKGKLANNIDLSSVCYKVDATVENDISWEPIGDSEKVVTQSDIKTVAYQGTFDGCNYRVSNLYIYSDSSKSNYLGLFGSVKGAYIKNLSVDGSVTSACKYVSGIAGLAEESTISNCYNYADINNTGSGNVIYAGGIVACSNISSIIEGCGNNGTINKESYDGCKGGGIVGLAYHEDLIINCYNKGSVNGNYAGGIVGYTMSNLATTHYTQIINCYNIGDVTGTTCVGGIFGGPQTYTTTITNCYNAWPTANSNNNISGDDTGATITTCYYDSTMSSIDNQGTGYSKEDMQSGAFAELLTTNATTYNDNNPNNYNNTSGIEASDWECDGDYPTLVAGINSNIKVVDIYYDGDYYNIYSADGMQAFADLVNGNDSNSANANIEGEGYASFDGVKHLDINGRLMQDVDLYGSEGNTWTPIGSGNVSSDTDTAYKGLFDGNGYAIKNLNINGSNSVQGLFGATYQASIVDLEVGGSVNCTTYSFSNEGHISLIVGSARESTFRNCITTEGSTVTHTDTGFNDSAGGIAGYSNCNTFIECVNNATITGSISVGGIVGTDSAGSVITDCSNSGYIYAKGSYSAGGIAGRISNGTIINCSNSGTIKTSDQHAGGIAGTTETAVICNCYNTGEITGEKQLGGIVGYTATSSKLYNCYNTGDVTETTDSGAIVGAEDDDPSTFSYCYYLGSGNDSVSGGTAYTSDAMTGSVFAGILNTNAYYYCKDNPTLVKPCAWSYKAGNYPTLDNANLPKE